MYFRHDHEHINGGIQVYIDHCHDAQRYNIPLNKMAYILYNMAVADLFDPLIYEKFEKLYSTTSQKSMSGRYAFGALWAYYKSNQGSLYGIDFWTSKLQDNIDDMRVQEVNRLLEAFRDNRQLHRDHIRELLDKYFKHRVILAFWDKEVAHN